MADGVSGRTLGNLPEGIYTVRVRAEKPIDVKGVRIEAQKTTAVELRKEGQELAIVVAAAKGS